VPPGAFQLLECFAARAMLGGVCQQGYMDLNGALYIKQRCWRAIHPLEAGMGTCDGMLCSSATLVSVRRGLWQDAQQHEEGAECSRSSTQSSTPVPTNARLPTLHLCHLCRYARGVCAMCGKQVLDTKDYKQSQA
jgi:hypothetical protein